MRTGLGGTQLTPVQDPQPDSVVNRVQQVSERARELRSQLQRLGTAIHGPQPECPASAEGQPGSLVAWMETIYNTMEDCHAELRRVFNSLGL